MWLQSAITSFKWKFKLSIFGGLFSEGNVSIHKKYGLSHWLPAYIQLLQCISKRKISRSKWINWKRQPESTDRKYLNISISNSVTHNANSSETVTKTLPNSIHIFLNDSTWNAAKHIFWLTTSIYKFTSFSHKLHAAFESKRQSQLGTKINICFLPYSHNVSSETNHHSFQ